MIQINISEALMEKKYIQWEYSICQDYSYPIWRKYFRKDRAQCKNKIQDTVSYKPNLRISKHLSPCLLQIKNQITGQVFLKCNKYTLLPFKTHNIITSKHYNALVKPKSESFKGTKWLKFQAVITLRLKLKWLGIKFYITKLLAL